MIQLNHKLSPGVSSQVRFGAATPLEPKMSMPDFEDVFKDISTSIMNDKGLLVELEVAENAAFANTSVRQLRDPDSPQLIAKELSTVLNDDKKFQDVKAFLQELKDLRDGNPLPPPSIKNAIVVGMSRQFFEATADNFIPLVAEIIDERETLRHQPDQIQSVSDRYFEATKAAMVEYQEKMFKSLDFSA